VPGLPSRSDDLMVAAALQPAGCSWAGRGTSRRRRPRPGPNNYLYIIIDFPSEALKAGRRCSGIMCAKRAMVANSRLAWGRSCFAVFGETRQGAGVVPWSSSLSDGRRKCSSAGHVGVAQNSESPVLRVGKPAWRERCADISEGSPTGKSATRRVRKPALRGGTLFGQRSLIPLTPKGENIL